VGTVQARANDCLGLGGADSDLRLLLKSGVWR